MNGTQAIKMLDRAILCAIYVAVFFIPFSVSGIEISIAIAIAMYALKSFVCRDFSFLKSKDLIFLIPFFIFCVLSLVNSGPMVNISIRALFFKWGKYILFFIILQNTLNTSWRVNVAVAILLIITIAVNIDGLFQLYSGKDLLHHNLLINGKISASFRNSNSFGAYMGPVSILLLALACRPGLKNIPRVALFLVCALSVTCFALTFSRGAYAGFIAGLVVMLFLFKKIRPILIFVVAIFAGVFISGGLKSTPAFFQNFLRIGNDSDRIALASAAWEMIKQHPILGMGIGTFMGHFKEYAKISGVYYAHNCFLQIWAETGILSLISFVFFIGFLLYRGIKIFKNNRDYLLLGLVSCMVAYIAHSLLDAHLYSLQLATLFWVLAGILSSRVNLLGAAK